MRSLGVVNGEKEKKNYPAVHTSIAITAIGIAVRVSLWISKMIRKHIYPGCRTCASSRATHTNERHRRLMAEKVRKYSPSSPHVVDLAHSPSLESA